MRFATVTVMSQCALILLDRAWLLVVMPRPLLFLYVIIYVTWCTSHPPECDSFRDYVITTFTYQLRLVMSPKLLLKLITYLLSYLLNVQVLGCHSRRASASSGAVSVHVDQWPGANGTTCQCYEAVKSGKLECIATCAGEISNHHISQSTGTGLVVASCFRGMTVLGCGSAAATNASSSHRVAVVAMGTTCRCHDDHGVTCYALCGVVKTEGSQRRPVRGLLTSGALARAASLLQTTALSILGLVLVSSM